MFYFLLLWLLSSFCLYPVFVRWVSDPLRKLYQIIIEQKRWNTINILNMQLAKKKWEKQAALTQKQGEKRSIKTERL